MFTKKIVNQFSNILFFILFVHAGEIYSRCMQWSGAKEMIVPQVGLPDGIVSQLYSNYKLKN